jgi:pimeloyl-ACP methyl ester carboxylesterase
MIIVISVILLILIIRCLIFIKQNIGLEVNLKQFFKINNIEHYVTIRGKKADAPILITLHGGPNCSLIPYSYTWQKELENNCIVVNYDQRLCGRTAMKNKCMKNVTQDELIEDLKDLIDLLKNMFQSEKVYLLGHSGGTILGMDFTEKYPEYVEKYIGVSQVYNFKKAIKSELNNILNDSKLSVADKIYIDKIVQNDENIDSIQELMLTYKYIFKYLKQPEPILKLLLMPIFSPYMRIKDWWYFIHNNKGDEEYGFLKFNLEDKIINSNVKYNFILGAEDHTICPNLIRKYVNNKENMNVYIIKECGHVPMYSKTKEFNEIIKGIISNYN